MNLQFKDVKHHMAGMSSSARDGAGMVQAVEWIGLNKVGPKKQKTKQNNNKKQNKNKQQQKTFFRNDLVEDFRKYYRPTLNLKWFKRTRKLL